MECFAFYIVHPTSEYTPQEIENFIFHKTSEFAEKKETDILEIYTDVAYDYLGRLDGRCEDPFIDNGFFLESGFYKSVCDDIRKLVLRVKIKPECRKGLYKCKNKKNGKVCGCDEFYCWQQQTRSADEPMTLFAQCKDCGRKIKE